MNNLEMPSDKDINHYNSIKSKYISRESNGDSFESEDRNKSVISEIDTILKNSKKNKTEINDESENIDENEICKSIESFYNNNFEKNKIYVRADRTAYNDFVRKLDTSRKNIFKEAFNLIIISKLYRIDEIDKIISLFNIINEKMMESTAIEFCRVVFPISENILFKIAFLICLDLPFERKSSLIRKKSIPQKYKLIRP